ncbi:MAG: gephyrin-like molybdotransferase Glp [Chloroflexota bacterium]
MLQVNEARERLLSYFSPVQSEMIKFSDALGRVLSADIYAEQDSPGFSHSAMDGIAVRSADISTAGKGKPVPLKIVGKIAAGDHPGNRVGSGEGVLIMTGAMVPPGADAVVRVEDTDLDFSKEALPSEAQVVHPVSPGENIRIQGENYNKGSLILNAGEALLPQDVGMLAMLGKETVSVYRQPRVGIFSSGDELIEPGNPLSEGQIWNSNSHMLSALVKSCGSQVVDLGIVADTELDILSAFEQLIEAKVDLIITSGGVSMGVHDYVRKVIEKHGKLDFWKVNMRPGKPLAFGKYKGTQFVGLPGNPVSSFVAYTIFVCPAIMRLAGKREENERIEKAVIETDFFSDGRESYLPGTWKVKGKQLRVTLTGNQSSGNLYALVQSNCLIKIPAGVQLLRRDSIVDIRKKY